MPIMDRSKQRPAPARSPNRICVGLLAVALSLPLGGCGTIMDYLSTGSLSSPPNGPETPASFGSPFEAVTIQSGDALMKGNLVLAPEACGMQVSILIFHGGHETISQWANVQVFLRDHCISTLVFDYRGNGDSGGRASFSAMTEDARAAYEYARHHLSKSGRLYLLGHSVGNAVMLPLAASLGTEPNGLIVANAFSSASAFASRKGWFWYAASHFMSDIWDNVDVVKHVNAPILVIGSEADKVIPIMDSQAIMDAANQPKSFATFQDYPHNAIYQNPSEDWWRPVFAFIGAK